MDNTDLTLYTHLPAKKADLIVLILASQHIKTRVQKHARGFDIRVTVQDEAKAKSAVDAYFKENRAGLFKQIPSQIPLSSFKSATAFFIIGLLAIIHFICIHLDIHRQVILKFGASALYILQGETFRAITALFLHADIQHLVGNMAGMVLFAAPVISVSGYGAGCFVLLFSGTLGNLFNAYLYRTAHLSIGASTAVMGAAGLLAAFQVTQKRPFRFNNLVPVCAGAILVGLFSHGEHTDVWAHIFGFVAGVDTGILFFPLNRVVNFRYKDIILLMITLLILVSAFISGF